MISTVSIWLVFGLILIGNGLVALIDFVLLLSEGGGDIGPRFWILSLTDVIFFLDDFISFMDIHGIPDPTVRWNRMWFNVFYNVLIVFLEWVLFFFRCGDDECFEVMVKEVTSV